MVLTADILDCMRRSVLCWLATVSKEGIPNVSPKEIFHVFQSDKIIIANIASPQSVRNIKENENICISFIDILVQKGFQLKGKALIIDKSDALFREMEAILLEMTGGKFPFASIIEISIESAKPIIAPKYLLYPDTKESDQINEARKAYNLG